MLCRFVVYVYVYVKIVYVVHVVQISIGLFVLGAIRQGATANFSYFNFSVSWQTS